MEKKSIFKKIDELYTKVTKVIIGDIPHDGETQYISSKDPKSTSPQNQETNIQSSFLTVKEKILNLGKPNDEKALLYHEVVKREKQEKKEADKQAKTSKKTTKSKTTSTKTKKPAAKKVSTNKTSSTKTETTKKKPTAKTAATKSTTTTKKTTTKTSTEKKPVAKKATATKKPATKTATKSTSTKSTESKKTTSTKKATTKTTSKKEATKKKPDVKKPATTKSTDSKTSAKKVPAKKDSVKKETSSKKTTAAKGSKRDAKIALYIKDIKKHYGEVDEAFVAIVVKNLGPSIYKKDAELVSCSDPKELDTVRRNFLIKKLGIDASRGVLDAAIQDVCTELKGVRTKYRATFYYALAKKFKKESVLS
ncbi:MAG TPA: DUF2853 family protein [Epsilonproteobacteria bacterium]|nr:DUF2853 family protein [Campylobacterota bacterium]